jgi:hypothetical protein
MLSGMKRSGAYAWLLYCTHSESFGSHRDVR